jgi:hypothetical protein
MGSEDGAQITSTFRTYKVPTGNETPDIETYFLGIPDTDGQYGAKEGLLAFGLWTPWGDRECHI